MNDAVAAALDDGLQAQQWALRRELERLQDIEPRILRVPTTESWQGIARDAFDRELTVLRSGFNAAVAALEESIACTARARESSHSHVG